MQELALILVVCSAVLHATWNALVKVAGDRFVVLTAVALGQTTFGLILIPFVPFPTLESWPYIVTSTFLQYGYFIFLYKAYENGGFSQVYSIARGAAPVIVTILAYIFTDEIIPLISVIGIIIVSLGIMGISFVANLGVRLSGKGLQYSLLTALMIAGYTVSDGIGVRLNVSPLSFVAWLFALMFPLVIMTSYIKRAVLVTQLKKDAWKFVGCAVCSSFAYAMVIVASAYIPLSFVSAIRETSVVIAVLIGVVFLGERPWLRRLAMSCVVLVGILFIAFGKY